MTKEQFFNAYRALIIANCSWAIDDDKLAKYLIEVIRFLEGNQPAKWSTKGQSLAEKAWQQIGGMGKITDKKLQSLPH